MHGHNELLLTVYVNIPSTTTTLCVTYMVCMEIKQHEPYIWLPHKNVLVMCMHVWKTTTLFAGNLSMNHIQDNL